MIKIRELEQMDEQVMEDLRVLMSELSERIVFSSTNLIRILEDKNSHLYVAWDEGHIVGCATLCLFHSPTGRKASVEDVVVTKSYRGRHIGKALMEHVLHEAKKWIPLELHLTSKPHRVAANRLYQALGFERKETNCYRLNL